MNKSFKVVFNKARGALMVVNEITSSVQAKGTKTVVAAAVAAVAAGSALAADVRYEQTEGQSGYSPTTAEQSTLVFAKDDVLHMSITGDQTRAYGLLASGKEHVYTNEGTIKLNLAAKDAAKFYRVKGMMADMGGTAVNAGTIDVTNAYGMTVGSSKGQGEVNTLINNGVINVAAGEGAGMEVAPTGSSDTVGTAKAAAENNGTINVGAGSLGVVIAGKDGQFVNNGKMVMKVWLWRPPSPSIMKRYRGPASVTSPRTSFC